MNFERHQSTLELLHNVPVPLRTRCGLRITCTAGKIWLTVAGEAGDIFLLPGESHDLRGPGLALLEGIGNAQARLQGAQPRWRLLPQTWWRVLANTIRRQRTQRRRLLPTAFAGAWPRTAR